MLLEAEQLEQATLGELRYGTINQGSLESLILWLLTPFLGRSLRNSAKVAC
jgi:hypothetical protein